MLGMEANYAAEVQHSLYIAVSRFQPRNLHPFPATDILKKEVDSYNLECSYSNTRFIKFASINMKGHFTSNNR